MFMLKRCRLRATKVSTKWFVDTPRVQSSCSQPTALFVAQVVPNNGPLKQETMVKLGAIVCEFEDELLRANVGTEFTHP